MQENAAFFRTLFSWRSDFATSTVTSTKALSGAAASATIFIGSPLQITYAANLSVGESPVRNSENRIPLTRSCCVSCSDTLAAFARCSPSSGIPLFAA